MELIEQMLKNLVIISASVMLSACVTTTNNSTTTATESESKVDLQQSEKVDNTLTVIETNQPYQFIICRFNGNVEKLQRSTGDILFSALGSGFNNFQYNFFKAQEDELKMIGYSQSIKTFGTPQSPTCQIFSHTNKKLFLYSAFRNAANFYALQGGTAQAYASLNEDVPTLIFAGNAGTSGFGYKWAMSQIPLSKELYENCQNNENGVILNTEKNRKKLRSAEEALNQEIEQTYTTQLERMACKSVAIAWAAAPLSEKQKQWGEKNAEKVYERRYDKE